MSNPHVQLPDPETIRRNCEKRRAMNPERIERGEFVEPTDATEPCRDGIGRRLGIVLETLALPQDGPEVEAAMIYWFCCKRTMIGDLRFYKLVDPKEAMREARGEQCW